VERAALLCADPAAGGCTCRADFGLELTADAPVLAGASPLALAIEQAGGPVALHRLLGVPDLRDDASRLVAGGFVAAVPVLNPGGLAAVVLLGEVREGGAPSTELLQLAHFLAAPVAPLLAALEDRPRRTCA
jgi:GAF domain-containing protein